MKINEIKELLKAIDNTSLEYVKLENAELKLEVSKKNSSLKNNIKNEKDTLKNSEEIELESINHENINEYENSQNKDNLYIVKAPLMGTFYPSPSPNEKSFVNIGDIVKEGDKLCILEAMKLMNEINSEIEGEIVEILVESEELVEYNQPLFKIRPL
ncbi:acetyl-CoA carboxylase biotin carboxyl carrier protein [Romboutsia sp. 1001285H_161024_C4]|uniref:acetyl-CoA carboxylase biotin carboxyl carrier protein n=1 Tax=Romboutsia sp. 1001285H_161024_C4 TaxID=2787109 RepID=UPI00189A1EA7|nr:acetyl-CoA carboxylase biotin carboxyl carrier protein [Romboutsia sp. 1001285H_161024_C4]